METLQQYFERSDTPMAGSPVGLAMQLLLHEHPEMTFEAARAEARKNPFRGNQSQVDAILTRTAEQRQAMGDRLAKARAARTTRAAA